MKKITTIVLAALVLTACATPQTDSERQAAINKINLGYAFGKAAASTYVSLPPCADASASVCSNPIIAREIAKALIVADVAIAQARAQIASTVDRTKIEEWTAYALAAIDVLVKALATYGIK